MELSAIEGMRLLFSCFTAILFLQSGLDKIANWKGEKSFYTDHFSKSFLGSLVPLLMPIITFTELAAGILSAVGVVMLLLGGNHTWGCWGMLLSCIALLMLFFGQRIAKDYAGAATLVPYFLCSAVGLYFYMI